MCCVGCCLSHVRHVRPLVMIRNVLTQGEEYATCSYQPQNNPHYLGIDAK